MGPELTGYRLLLVRTGLGFLKATVVGLCMHPLPSSSPATFTRATYKQYRRTGDVSTVGRNSVWVEDGPCSFLRWSGRTLYSPLLDNAIDCLSSDLRPAVQLEFACVLRGADSRESLTIAAIQDFKATSVIMLGHPGIGETPPILDVRLPH